MNRWPSVSVILPALNEAKHLERAILSVTRQDYPGSLQAIVADGGSQDSSVEILNRFRGSVTWWSNPDGGTADAVKKAFTRASGEVIAVLSARDFYLEDALRLAVAGFRESSLPSLVSAGQVGLAPKKEIWAAPLPRGLVQPRSILFGPVPGHACVLFRRDAMEAVGGLRAELGTAAFLDLWVRLTKLRPGLYVPQYVAARDRVTPSKTAAATRYEQWRAFLEKIQAEMKDSSELAFTDAECSQVLQRWREGFDRRPGRPGALPGELKNRSVRRIWVGLFEKPDPATLVPEPRDLEWWKHAGDESSRAA